MLIAIQLLLQNSLSNSEVFEDFWGLLTKSRTETQLLVSFLFFLSVSFNEYVVIKT